MPVYNEDTFNYETLLRFGDTGPKKGQLTGASRTTITQTTKDGVPIATNINPPEQLALIAGEEGELLSTVLGEVNAETIVQNGQLQASLAELNSIVAQQMENLTQLYNEKNIAERFIADMKAKIAELEGKLSVAQEDMDSLSLTAQSRNDGENSSQYTEKAVIGSD
jgi:hypothetical protein